MLSWGEYVRQGTVRKVPLNFGRIRTLIKMADEKLSVMSKIELTEESASVVFTNHYDALREICEALALLNGYKIYQHEAVGLFLREILKENAIFAKFDKFRMMRNGVNYYGTPIPLTEALQNINDIREIIKNIKEKYLSAYLK